MIKITLDVNDHVIKKNNRPIFYNRGTKVHFIGKSKDLANAENYLELKLRSEKNRLRIETITYPISVCYRFYFAEKNSRKFKACDLSNLFEIVSDALQASEIIKNDNLIQSFDGSRKIQTRNNFNSLEIEITQYLEGIGLPDNQTTLFD